MNKKSVLSLSVCLYVFVWDGAGIHTSRHIAHAGGFRQGEGKVGHRAGTLDGGYNKLMTSKHVDLNWKPNPTVKIIRGGWNVWEPEGDNHGAA